MLFTKSILSSPRESDGVRISVMSRHTLSDGFTPNPWITSGKYDEWLKNLAPPTGLIGDYYKRELPWEKFEARYQAYIRQPEIASQIKKLARRALTQDITLLCIEELGENCHRRILSKECQRYGPRLVVAHF